MEAHGIALDTKAVRDCCRWWKVKELSVFGSILRDDFRPDSDVDLLVDYEEGVMWSLFDLIDAKQELTACLGRKVDLVVKGQLKWVIRDRVLESAKVIYAA
jgi:predicted nucleotidyltransferase